MKSLKLRIREELHLIKIFAFLFFSKTFSFPTTVTSEILGSFLGFADVNSEHTGAAQH